MKVAFIHPDLGIGGAERLVVDAAVGLQTLHKHNVTMYTAHRNVKHCFAETRDGTLDVRVYGDFLPTKILGRFFVFCSILRMLFLTMVIWVQGQKYDVFVVDQVSAHIPLLRMLFRNSKIVFYGHFPDKLLAKPATGLLGQLKKVYRGLFDWIEEYTTGKSDIVLVNSNFTKQQFQIHFPNLKSEYQVLYPPINAPSYDKVPDNYEKVLKEGRVNFIQGKKAIVSINRFERKKGIDLAVKSFAIANEQYAGDDLVLVLAGGYDKNVAENVEYFAELKAIVEKNKLQDKVLFLPSFSEEERYALLHEGTVVVYTPENEHFGIVPVEAMYCNRCLVAANSGGPLESVQDGVTGYLVAPEPKAFANAILKFLNMTEKERRSFGEQARKRVQQRYTLEVFADSLDKVIKKM